MVYLQKIMYNKYTCHLVKLKELWGKTNGAKLQNHFKVCEAQWSLCLFSHMWKFKKKNYITLPGIGRNRKEEQNKFLTWQWQQLFSLFYWMIDWIVGGSRFSSFNFPMKYLEIKTGKNNQLASYSMKWI